MAEYLAIFPELFKHYGGETILFLVMSVIIYLLIRAAYALWTQNSALQKEMRETNETRIGTLYAALRDNTSALDALRRISETRQTSMESLAEIVRHSAEATSNLNIDVRTMLSAPRRGDR
jgi:type II secretory pathway component PulM